METKISFDLGRIGGHTSSSLDDRSIVVVRQASRKLIAILAVCKNFKVRKLQF